MKNAIVTLSKKLIAIPSVPDNTQSLEQALKTVLSELDAYTIEWFEKNGVKSVLIYKTKKRPKKFKILLNGHLDILPGKDYQYKPKIVGNRLYGVGAVDMKASVACLITAFKEVVDEVDYPLGLQLVTDEEPGGFNGTKYQIEKGVRADFVIAGESTNLRIANKAKGTLWLKIFSKGKTAHSAYPWKGGNAISEMNKFLKNIEEMYPNPSEQKWVTTVNISKVQTTNTTFNKIPDNCETWLDIRYIPEEKNTVLARIKKILPREFKISIIENDPPLLTQESNTYIRALQIIGEKITKKEIPIYGTHGTSDARHYILVKGAGVEFGPIGGGMGSDKEWVDIPSLETYTKILIHFLKNLSN
jgi:succinyl-diaminopimelate desuccinylase